MRGQTDGVPWLLLLLLITAVLVCTADDLLVLLESDAAVLHHLLHAWAPLEREMEILQRTATHCKTLQQRLLACGRASRVQWSPALTLSALPHAPALHPLSFSPIAFEGSNPLTQTLYFSCTPFVTCFRLMWTVHRFSRQSRSCMAMRALCSCMCA